MNNKQELKNFTDAKRHGRIVGFVERCFGDIGQDYHVMPNLIQHLSMSIESINIDRLRVEPAMTERLFSMGERENISCAKRTETNLFPYSHIHLFTSKKVAFTLAEVLITLGIIGIVAAMTIPSLVQNYKKHVVETRLQKFYSVINQAIRISEVEYGDKALWTSQDTDDFFNTYLKSHLIFIKYENKRVGTANDWRLVYLPDGSAFIFDIYGIWDDEGNQTSKTNGGHFIFCPYAKDCTDGKDYDKWGKKQFVFGFWPAGEVMPKYFKNKGVEPYLNGWDGNEETLYTKSHFGCNSEAKNFYCTAIIQQNGWKIPKNYPYRF